MSILGNYQNEYPLVSTADIGGHRVLGMSGSLVNYINTGNPNISQHDSFTPKKETLNKTKKVNVLDKISSTGAPITGYLIAGGVLTALLVKSIVTGDFTKLIKKIGNGISSGAKKSYAKNAPKVAQFFKDIPTKISEFVKKLPFNKKP